VPPSKSSRFFHVAGRGSLLLAMGLLAACAHLGKMAPSHWSLPWKHGAPPAAPMAHEVMVPGSDTDLPQAWNRNTLTVDLTGYTGEGELSLARAAGHDWPIRMAFTVRPGGFAHLEVRGDQRIVLTVPGDGANTVLDVPTALYSPNTAALVLHYGP
jgi:hypothetical protein